MNKVKLHTVWLLGMLFLMTACGDDEDYYYPPVKLEFVTVKAGADGLIKSLLPDKPQFRNPTKSLRALCPKTAKNEIFLVRTDFLPRVGRYASIMPPYPHLGLQTTAPPKRLAHP